jgi:3-hydroxyisobutyrate dehydrogenase-like beta-hydroxyacid dehydrogenase
MKAGFAELGRTGAGMAANLIKAAHEVSVYNRTPDRQPPLIELVALGASIVKRRPLAGSRMVGDPRIGPVNCS